VWNNSSLELQGYVFSMLMLRGPRGGSPWFGTNPTIIVTTPGYDRHFTLLEGLGYRMVSVDMQPDGPDVDAIEALVASNPDIRGILFVPTYSNPGGETISKEKAARLAGLSAANPGFAIFADDAYRVHHLSGERDEPVNFVSLCEAAGNPDGAWVFASTSKVTFAGAGLGFVASSTDNIKHLGAHLGTVSIGPNKVEQYRHVKFLASYPGGLEGLMNDHAAVITPKFEAVTRVLTEHLGDTGLARWSDPRGGYFISLDTTLPVADRVIALANEAGVSLTPAGATYPGGNDPHNSNIRLAPTRPAEVAEVELAMEVVATCIKLASEEYRAAQA
jgi:DNA-binding transcriptional MocR family regulator